MGEEGVSHLIQFAELESDLEVLEEVYEIGQVVGIEFPTPSRSISIVGEVKGFEYTMDVFDDGVYAGPYVACTLYIEEVDYD